MGRCLVRSRQRDGSRSSAALQLQERARQASVHSGQIFRIDANVSFPRRTLWCARMPPSSAPRPQRLLHGGCLPLNAQVSSTRRKVWRLIGTGRQLGILTPNVPLRTPDCSPGLGVHGATAVMVTAGESARRPHRPASWIIRAGVRHLFMIGPNKKVVGLSLPSVRRARSQAPRQP
jgi:hypothetical protein